MRVTGISGRLYESLYQHHQPDHTLLYQIIEYYPKFRGQLEAQGWSLPTYVQRKFEEFLTSGHLEHGFLRVRCKNFKHERLVASSCKRLGCCPSYGAQRMAESAALFVDEVLPREPMHQ